MSYDAIRAALETQLNAFAVAQELPVAFENGDYRPSEGEEFLQTFLLVGQPSAESIGTNGVERLNGLYQININSHRNVGSGVAFRRADEIAAEFPAGAELAHDGVTVSVARSWPSPAILRGDWFVVPVSVSWFAYI